MMQSVKSQLAGSSLALWARDLRDSKPMGVVKKSSELYRVINEYLPGVGTNIHWRDTDFEIVDFSWWKKVLESPFWTTKQIKYISEVSDCEAFSLFFLSICELFLKTNGVFSVGGTCKWGTSKGTETSSHRFNAIIASENNETVMYLVEPMYNQYVKVAKGSKSVTLFNVFGIMQMQYIPTNIFE